LRFYALDLSHGFSNFRFGEPQSSHDDQGFPGLNSGVILFRLDRMRKNSLYNRLLEADAVTSLTNKYSFKVIFTLYLNYLNPDVYVNNILKFNFFYHKKHNTSLMKLGQLILYREIMIAGYENHITHINTLCKQNATHFVLWIVCRVTGRF
jgi:hypothetical protein